uniref:Reverse transcriptase Ty1/copia-type domain-containing protein n=1 Tax=Solanum lycopersicum TaxID=4081 RepID=A0A3Q7GU98_SOLLC
MLIAGSIMREINNLKTRLSAAFEMKDLGPAKQILGMKISRDRCVGSFNLSQELYIEKSPKTAEERDHMALVPYASAVGSLMYAMVCTRHDIEHVVGVVSRYMANPGKEHWEVVKWLLRYRRGTYSTSLCVVKGKVTLQGFVDADLSGDVDSSKRSIMREINNLKTRLSAAFEMKDLGPAKQILGMKISRDRCVGSFNLSQELYIEKSPKTAEERDHMALVPYASTVGSLMYAMVCTRHDIEHVEGVVSRYMANPGKEYWEVVKWLLRYRRGTYSTSLCVVKGKVTLQGFVDANLGGDVDSSKSTSR